MDLSRRGFIKLSAGAAAAGGALGGAGEADAVARAGAPVMVAQAGQPTPLGFNPADPALKYELVIANGDVLDPVQKTRGLLISGSKVRGRRSPRLPLCSPEVGFK
jgi:hypothetical protein